jgi:hypothetical protein
MFLFGGREFHKFILIDKILHIKNDDIINN